MKFDFRHSFLKDVESGFARCIFSTISHHPSLFKPICNGVGFQPERMVLPDGHIGLTSFRITSLCAYSAVVGSRQDLRCVFSHNIGIGGKS
jgi:hypothetical protein